MLRLDDQMMHELTIQHVLGLNGFFIVFVSSYELEELMCLRELFLHTNYCACFSSRYHSNFQPLMVIR